MSTKKTKIQIRRGTEAEFIAANPILASGEPAYAIDSNIFKVGDGELAWNDLDGITGGGGGSGVTMTQVLSAISGVVIDGAPANLNTLNELAAAINDDSNYYINTQEKISAASGIAAYASGQTLINHNDIVFVSGNALFNLVEDVSPELGGNLNVNTYDITGNGDINISGSLTAISGSLHQLTFNTTLPDPDLLQGQIAWNATEGTIDLGFTETYTQHVGEELHYRVRNDSGSVLPKATPVYASGLTPGSNNRIIVAPFTADGSVREIRFMGLVTENIDNSSNGYTTHFGYIRGIDTRGDAATNGTSGKIWTTGEPAWQLGDILYPHPTVAGKLTKVEPKHSISVAIILNVHQNAGKLFVRPTSYGHLGDNHDVDLSGVANLDTLVYNSGTDYWEPKHAVLSETAGITGASGVNNIVTMSQNDYDNLGSYDPNTIYFIV